jgi:hypothetical protein
MACTTTTLGPLIPECDNPDQCTEIISSACVAYTGDALVNSGIANGDTLTEALVKIDDGALNAANFVALFNSSAAVRDVIADYIASL